MARDDMISILLPTRGRRDSLHRLISTSMELANQPERIEVVVYIDDDDPSYDGLEMEFDLTAIEALNEDESTRVSREVQLLDRGVLTINEVRRSRKLADVSWGEGWAKDPNRA